MSSVVMIPHPQYQHPGEQHWPEAPPQPWATPPPPQQWAAPQPPQQEESMPTDESYRLDFTFKRLYEGVLTGLGESMQAVVGETPWFQYAPDFRKFVHAEWNCTADVTLGLDRREQNTDIADADTTVKERAQADRFEADNVAGPETVQCSRE